MMDSERRGNTRSPTRLVADVKNLRTGKIQHWLTKDLSESGIGLVADEPIERGTRLEISLWLPEDAAPLVMEGEVVWMMTASACWQEQPALTELGVIFTHLPSKVKAALSRYAATSIPPTE